MPRVTATAPRSPLPKILAALGAAGLAAVAGTGVFEVRPGEVVVLADRAAAVARVCEPGWHWRWPLGRAPLRLPRETIAVSRDFQRKLSHGLPAVVSVSGRFAVRPGEEGRWVSAAGWKPFLDGLWALVESELARTSSDKPEFGWQAEELLRARLEAALAEAGARADGLLVAMPADKNPAAFDDVKKRLGALALPSGRKVLVVGWDGADWLMIRPLLAAGRMPNLKRLIDSGVSGELRSLKPLLSPLLWTSIATGKPVTEHGVADFLVRDRESGDLVPIGSDARRVHALWTILPAFGLRSHVVGWWATWPAEPTLGTLVTDRVAYQLFGYQEDSSGLGKVHPPNAWGWVRDELVSAEKIRHEDIRRFVDVDAEEFERLWTSLPPEQRHQNRVNHLRKILATTRSYHAIARSLLAEQADLTLVYYEGTDTVGHLFARYLPPRLPGVDPAEFRRFSRALAEFYVYADELLGELVARADPRTAVIVLSDHGFFTGTARPAADPSDFTTGAPQWHRLHGIIVAAGGGIPRGSVTDATLLDVTPTVLSLLGLPVPRDLPGRVLTALSPPGARPPAERRLASYQVLPRPAAAAVERSKAADEERLRELAALGYISAEAASGSSADPHSSSSAGGSPAGAPDTQAVATQAYNLGRIMQQKGDLVEAERQYRIAIERLPSFGPGWVSLAQTASLRGNHSQAFDTLAEGFARRVDMPLGGLTGLVDEAKHVGRLDEAQRALQNLTPVYGRESAFHAAWGLLHEERGRLDPALESYERALGINPLDELSIERAIGLLKARGREAEARRRMENALSHASGSLGSLNQLAVVCLRQGWPREGERIFRQVLESDPGNPGVLANLGASLVRQGRHAEAVDILREALRREPDNAQNHFNLGAILAGQGRDREALAAFARAHQEGLRGARVHVAMAKMHFRLGERGKCRTELEEALKVEPENREARELLRTLEG
jgi:tetratricopeptide (TPR) repeat protein